MIFFYTLSALCLLSCTLLVVSRNPVYSLLNLVLFFICGSLHLLYLGVDFLAYVFVIVYVGALAVLFLFVVIILDIKLTKLKNTQKEIPIVFLCAILSFFYLDYTNQDFLLQEAVIPKFSLYYDNMPIVKSLGYALYTQYVIHFVLCGLVLLVAIIGAIVLTSKGRYLKNKAKEKQFKQCERFHSVGKRRFGPLLKSFDNLFSLLSLLFSLGSLDPFSLFIILILIFIAVLCMFILYYLEKLHIFNLSLISEEDRKISKLSFKERLIVFTFFLFGYLLLDSVLSFII